MNNILGRKLKSEGDYLFIVTKILMKCNDLQKIKIKIKFKVVGKLELSRLKFPNRYLCLIELDQPIWLHH